MASEAYCGGLEYLIIRYSSRQVVDLLHVNKCVFGSHDLSSGKGQPEVVGTPNWLISVIYRVPVIVWVRPYITVSVFIVRVLWDSKFWVNLVWLARAVIYNFKKSLRTTFHAIRIAIRFARIVILSANRGIESRELVCQC